MKKHFLVFITLLLVPFTANAQKRAFAIEDLYQIKSISDVHFAPDGRSVLYADHIRFASSQTQRPHLDDGHRREKSTAAHRGEDGREFAAFSPDGKWISYISSKMEALNFM